MGHVGPAGGQHIGQQLLEALPTYLRQQLEQGRVQGLRRGAAPRAQHGRVGHFHHVARPPKHGQRHRGLLEEVRQLLALALGFGAGGAVGGLAFAQGLLHGGAGLVGGVGEADDEQVLAALGGEAEVVIDAVGLVVDLKSVGLVGLVRAAVEVENTGGRHLRKAGEGRGARPLGQARHALGGGV